MIKYIVNFIDWLFVSKRLKVILFILMLLLIFLVANSFIKFIDIDEKILAAYMIGLSALCGFSGVTNYIKNILGKFEVIKVKDCEIRVRYLHNDLFFITPWAGSIIGNNHVK